MSLHDEHLKQALQNAPDRDMLPEVSTRKAVLNYAKFSMRPPKRSYYAGLNQWWKDLHVANWELASAGSVLAAVFVLVVFWNQQAKDSEWADAKPAEIATVDGPVEHAAESESEMALAEKQVEDQQQAGNKQLKETLPATASPMRSEAGNVLAVPAPRSALTEDKRVAIKVMPEESGTDIASSIKQLPKKSEVSVNQPAVINEAAQSLETKGSERAGEHGVSASAIVQPEVDSRKPVPVLKDNVTIQERELAERKTVGATLEAKHANAELAEAIVSEGGHMVAKRDIQAGLLRNIYLDAQHDDAQKCSVTQSADVFDTVTGYRVEFISGCYSTAALIREIDIYNQAMYAWHAKNGK